jgi:para-aminobenzoate synthetase component 1
MTQIRVVVQPLALPDGPRGTMARLRAGGHYALLESALVMPRQSQWSYIAGPAVATLHSDEGGTRLERDGHILACWDDPFAALAAVVVVTEEIQFEGERPEGLSFVGGWVGVLGYDLARNIERLPVLAEDDPTLPRQWWMAVDQVLAFHHPSGQWWHAMAHGPADRWPWSREDRQDAWTRTLDVAAGPLPERGQWHAGARMLRTDRQQFESGVTGIRESIANGDVLQVNLTRREEAEFEGDPWALYEDLACAHPAPFAAYLEGPGFAIASCSPERFLHRRGDLVEARPIKGTVARGEDDAEDMARRSWLAASLKDRAENLMIVDLMRNDLGRVAAIGSVRVPELFALEPYTSVWQMVSTVTARLRPDVDSVRLLRACWPPGSMTGAPKVKAMEIIEALEPVRRGWYAGSTGYLDVTGNLDLSVVIRTAIVADHRVMVQFGGGIVADSEPASEWLETVAKGVRLTGVLDQHLRGGQSSAVASHCQGSVGKAH